MDIQKNLPIQGPLIVTLHDDGVDYYMHKGERLSKVTLYGGSQHYGHTFPQADAKALQKMAVVGYIHRIEYAVRNISSERRNIIDLTKLMSYGMLYRQFDARVWDSLLSSDLTHLWNRQYPKLSITFGVDTRKLGLSTVLKANEAAINVFKQGLLKSVQEMISRNQKLLEDEKRKQMFLAIRFINMVDPFAWLLLSVFRQNSGASKLLRDIQLLLVTYLTKSDSPEYLALMLIELIVINGGITAAGIEGEQKVDHDPVFLSFEFSARKREQGERTRMKITLAKEQADFETLRDEVEDKKFLNIRERSLDAFFEGQQTGGISNREIGLYYLSYLKEACKKMNISFESFVNVVPATNHTLMNLMLTF